MIRKCALILVGIALLSKPLTAQDNRGASKAKSRDVIATNTDESPTAPAAVRVRARNILALPEAPHPTPFPAAQTSNDEGPGRLLPRYEIAAGYSYVLFNPGGSLGSFDNNGAT